MKKTRLLNENRLFQKIQYFFENPAAVLTEIAQNATRGGASILNISYDGEILTVYDNGRGIKDPASFVVLADSDWPEDIETNENPSGFGAYILLSISDTVTLKSLFGTLGINCNKFFKNKEYRETVLSTVDTAERYMGGTKIVASVKKSVSKSILDKTSDLAFFPLSVSINGCLVIPQCASTVLKTPEIETQYQGNDVFIDIGRYGWRSGIKESLVEDLLTVWYGMPIRKLNSPGVVIDVKKGSPLTPVLPYRTALKEDEKMADFAEFIRKTIVMYCIEKINSLNSAANHWATIKLMQVVESNATQDEIELLDKFFVRANEYFYSDDPDAWHTYDVFVDKGEGRSLISEIVSLKVINYKGEEQVFDHEELKDILCLPYKIITTLDYPRSYPSWMEIVEKEVKIKVDNSKKVHNGLFVWQQADIHCEGKEVKCLALAEGWGGDVFYQKGPGDFTDIEDCVFCLRAFNPDGDSYDTQKNDFNEDVKSDIVAITGEYERGELLAGFSDVPGLAIENIASLKISKKVIHVTKIDGSKITLNLAA